MQFLAIGDVHGSSAQLRVLLDLCERYRERQVVFLGDFVDIGPDSPGTIDVLIAFGTSHPETVFLMGNHDVALTEYLATGDFGAYAALGGIATIRAYCGEVYGDVHDRLKDAIPETHKRFLANLGIFLETSDYLFSHGGYDPETPLDRSLQAMVLSSHQRLFECEPPLAKLAICGHYFQESKTPFMSPRLVCIDTGCAIIHGPLTGMMLPERRIVQIQPDLTVSFTESTRFPTTLLA